MTKLKNSTLRRGLAASVMAGAAVLAMPSVASADVVSGWIGLAGPNGGGVYFLQNSTIINSPALAAESKIWTITGIAVADGDMGVRARLFKSGALCEAIDYQYNLYTAPELTAGTTRQCGTGSYNSHGFVAVWNGKNAYRTYVTFPSNPLNYTVPAARSATPDTSGEVESGTNETGQTYGSGDTDGDLPELVAVIANNGEIGYIPAAELEGPALSHEEVKQLPIENINGQEVRTTPDRTVPVFATDGVTEIGDFTIS